MKRVILFFATLLTISACSLSEIEFDEQMYYDDVYGKWRFYSDSAADTGFSWIELTEGRYFFAYKSDGSIDYGKYSKTGYYQFTLEGYATLDISTYSESKLEFDLTLDGATESISASAYLASDVTDGASEDEQYDDNIYAVWEVNNVTYDNCGCICVESCSCQSAISGSECTAAGCNCFCNENRISIRYVLIAQSGSIITINSNGETALYSWYWYEENSQNGIIKFYLSDDMSISIVNVATQTLNIEYTKSDGNVYYVAFTCKSSGQIEI